MNTNLGDGLIFDRVLNYDKTPVKSFRYFIAKKLINLDTNSKNNILLGVSKALLEKKELIKSENKKDLEDGKAKGISSALLDRLELTDSRIEGMAESLVEIANFKDPIGEVLDGWKHPDGMQIVKQ